MTAKFWRLFLLSFVLFGAACSPNLNSSLAVPDMKFAGMKFARHPRAESSMLFVDEFVDRRDNTSLAKMGEKEIQANGEVVPSVVAGLKKALSEVGFSFSDSAPVILSGEIRQWSAEVVGTLPTKISSEAALFIEVLDPANKRVYSGVYKGYSNFEASRVNDLDLRNSLGVAMEEAIRQLTADKKLIELLTSY